MTAPASRDSETAPGALVQTRWQARRVAVIVASALFMDQLDSTVLTTAVPAIARDFGSDPLHLSLALTSYLLALAIFIPVSGMMADRFGSRTIFQGAIVMFTLGSILCAQAPNLPFLIAARFLQGTGGALMIPVGRLVLLRSVSKAELVMAMSWLLVPANIGPILGPPVGGFIVTYLSWRWIFYINIPIGIAGLLLASRYVPQLRGGGRQRLDWRGFAITSVGLPSLIFGLELITRDAANRGLGALLLATGGVAGILYWLHARRAASPILDLTLMRIPTFRLSVIAGSLSRVMAGATPFLVPLMLQLGFGLSAAQSGMITLAPACGAMLHKPMTRPIFRLLGFRNAQILGGVLALFATASCAFFRPGWPLWLIFVALMLSGYMISLQFMSYNTVAYADVEQERMSAATSFYVTFQQFFLTVGIATSAGALAVSERITGNAQPGFTDFSVAFGLCCTVAVAAVLVSLRLRPDAGRMMTGHSGQSLPMMARLSVRRWRRAARD